MKVLKGKSILKRVAAGKIRYYGKRSCEIPFYPVDDSNAEVERYRNALSETKEALFKLYEETLKKAGEKEAEIFNAHIMILEDREFDRNVREFIDTRKVNAEYAVSRTADYYSKMFEAMEDEFFKARSADILDVSERLIRILSGFEEENWDFDEPVILAAKELTPSETVQMDKKKILGFLTEQGSSTSHSAILARTMDIPAILALPVDESWNGREVVVDGITGTVYLDPDEDILNEFLKKKQEEEENDRYLLSLREKEDITKDGIRVRLYANIADEEDVEKVVKDHAAGIGLFRSEFLYLSKDTYPTEEEQFEAYRHAAEKMDGKEVIIRTLDIGADKTTDYFELDPEVNPALGYRAVRICLDRPELFKTQLRAILRAGIYGKLLLMIPMIISVAEVREVKKILKEVKTELTEEGIPYGDVPFGIMIETPAAALISTELAREVDFFSIGTNDLTQYTLAVDRQNEKLERTYDSHHKAVMKLIAMTVANGHREGIKVGICGELASDPALTETFIHMGVDELSVAPPFILPMRKKIRSISVTGQKDQEE